MAKRGSTHTASAAKASTGTVAQAIAYRRASWPRRTTLVTLGGRARLSGPRSR